MNTLLFSVENGIATITIHRPDKLNALNADVIQDLNHALDEVISNREIRSALITGSGAKAFVAGADISEFMELDSAAGEALARRGQELVFDKIEQCPKPVVAAVNGFALGGGCELAMACHFRIASSNARFGQPEVNLGLIPGYGGTQRLPQLVGKGKAMELCLSGRMMDAQEAHSCGLVNEVCEPDQLISRCTEILNLINTKSPMAMAGVIRCINQSGKTNGFETEITAFGACFGTDDMKEGVGAFLEKRKAVFA